MEVKPIPEKVLNAAKDWLRNWGREIMYYAGEEDGVFYFNGVDRDMSGKRGFGTQIAVNQTGKVKFIKDHLLSCAVCRNADSLNLSYNL